MINKITTVGAGRLVQAMSLPIVVKKKGITLDEIMWLMTSEKQPSKK